MSNDISSTLIIEKKKKNFEILDFKAQILLPKSQSIIEQFILDLQTLEPRILDFYRFSLFTLFILAMFLLLEVVLKQSLIKIMNFVFFEGVILLFFYQI